MIKFKNYIDLMLYRGHWTMSNNIAEAKSQKRLQPRQTSPEKLLASPSELRKSMPIPSKDPSLNPWRISKDTVNSKMVMKEVSPEAKENLKKRTSYIPDVKKRLT